MGAQWIFDIEGEKGFRIREKEVLEQIKTRQGIVLATGGGVVLTPENRTSLSSRGKVVYLKVSVKQQLERTHKDKKRPLLQVDNKQAELEKMMAEREHLYDEIADVIIETSDTTVRNVVHKIIRVLMDDKV